VKYVVADFRCAMLFEMRMKKTEEENGEGVCKEGK